MAPIAAAFCLAFASGGYFVQSWGTAAIALLGLLATTVIARDTCWGGPLGIVAMCGWAGLAVVQGVSSAWAHQPSAAVATMNRTLLYGAAFALALIGVRRVGDLSRLLDLALASSAAIAVYALTSRLWPSLVPPDPASRLSAPISYWNGVGTLVAFGVVLALGVAGHPRRSAAARAGAAALLPALLTVLLLTYSRGAMAALFVGIVLLLALAPGRLETAAVLLATAVAWIPLLGIVQADSRIARFSGGVPPSDGVEGRLLVSVVVATTAAAALGWVAATGIAAIPHDRRRAVGLGMATSGLIAVGVVAVTHPPAHGPSGWVERQIDGFTTFDVASREGAESITDRLAVAGGSGRWQMWQVAAEEFREAPIVGTGAGDYRFFWESERGIDLFVRNAHSLYLETLGESGALGLVLLLVPVAAVLAAYGLARRHGLPPEAARHLGIAVAAGAVVASHLAIDWAWQLPAVVLPAVAVGAGALKAAHLATGGAAATASPGGRAAGALAAVAGIALLTSAVGSAASVETARAQALRGDLTTALEGARSAARLNPQDPEPRLLEANILSDLGRPTEADAAFSRAAARSPRDWVIFADWAAAALARGDRRAAGIAARRAHQLNPRELRPRLLLESSG
jgi:cytochrome c-type biogenesis protein CcmH/NrfG